MEKFCNNISFVDCIKNISVFGLKRNRKNLKGCVQDDRSALTKRGWKTLRVFVWVTDFLMLWRIL